MYLCLCCASLLILSVFPLKEEFSNMGWISIHTCIIMMSFKFFFFKLSFSVILYLHCIENKCWPKCYNFGYVTELTKSRHQRMLKMVHRSCFLFMVVTPVKYLIFRGTHVKIGLLLVLLKITYSKSGRWPRTFTMTKMICPKNRQSLSIISNT